MSNVKNFYALWAKDINKYLSTCYNYTSLSDVREGILDYISIDQDNPENVKTFNLLTLLEMTGLELDSNSMEFDYSDVLEEEPTAIRAGKKLL